MDPSTGNVASQHRKGKKKNGEGVSTQRNRAQNWGVDQTTIMLNLVREEQVAHRVAGPGTFTKQFWNKLAPVLSSQSEPPRSGTELQSRWKVLKADFYDHKQCVDKTGWGWDPDKKVPVAPEESCWDELKKHNTKLYKCKTKAFIWYDIMNELCGSNIATGYYAMSGNLEDHVSQSDSSDSGNKDAERELDKSDIGAFKTVLDMEFPYSGAASVTSSDKRAREESIGMGSIGKKSKGDSSVKNKNSECNAAIDKLVEESRERRVLIEDVMNKDKVIASKLIQVKREMNMNMEDFTILQKVLYSELSKYIFMTLEGDELIEWIQVKIAWFHRQGK